MDECGPYGCGRGLRTPSYSGQLYSCAGVAILRRPGDGAEQREAEALMLDGLGARFRTTFTPTLLSCLKADTSRLMEWIRRAEPTLRQWLTKGY
jgi:hypothetical protein